MTAWTIPTDTGADAGPQVLRLTLDGAIYQLRLRWNARVGIWRLDVQDGTGSTLAAGLPVRNAGLPVNGAIAGQLGLPAGLLIALATATRAVDAGLDELGGRVVLCYRTEA